MSELTPDAGKPYQIVVAFDDSELSGRALEEALRLSEQRAPAELHVVTVAQTYGARLCLPNREEALPEEQAREAVRERVAEIVEQYRTDHGPLTIDRIAVYLLGASSTSNFGQPITDLAGAIEADLIVVGTHGRKGLERALLGSVASEVLRLAATSVYVVNPRDFIHGKKVPAIQPALEEGQPHLKHFEHRRTYHYVDKVSAWTNRTMPVT